MGEDLPWKLVALSHVLGSLMEGKGEKQNAKLSHSLTSVRMWESSHLMPPTGPTPATLLSCHGIWLNCELSKMSFPLGCLCQGVCPREQRSDRHSPPSSALSSGLACEASLLVYQAQHFLILFYSFLPCLLVSGLRQRENQSKGNWESVDVKINSRTQFLSMVLGW